MPSISTYTQNILDKYQVDLQRGFLPTEDPLLQLPAEFEAWDQLASNFTACINAGVIKKYIRQLPILDAESLNSKAELERAMLVLSCFAHAYIHDQEGEKELPTCISTPWDAVAKKLGRFPILSHASLVLNNWRRLDKNGPIALDNITTLIQFNGGLDEGWFYLITTNMEQVGAKGISTLLETMEQAKNKNEEQVSKGLDQLAEVLIQLKIALQRMYEQLDAHIFYKRIRPFLDSFTEVKYLGCTPELRNYHGGSAAQSSLLQSFDAGLGLNYDNNPRTKKYLHLMRKHMPPKHAAFIEFLEVESGIHAFAKANPSVSPGYQNAVEQLIELRNEHLKMVALYVVKEAAKYKEDATGTGGTSPLVFLKSIRNRNEEGKEFNLE